MKIYTKFKYLFHQLLDIHSINKRLKDKIVDCGIKEGLPFIKLKTGEIFFSYPPERYQERLYFLFNKKIRQKVKKECINVLYDINFRYLIPKTKIQTYNVGKYYDVKEGDIVLELGAYIGMYAIRLAKLVNDKGKVLAVEAVKPNFDILKRNILANDISNIIPINKAVWNKKEKIKFFIEKRQANSAIDKVVNNKKITWVEADTVDNIIKENKLKKVDFVRIQVNGAEKNVLEGMKETFKMKPIIMITIIYRDKKEIIQILEKYNYKVEKYKYAILAKPQ